MDEILEKGKYGIIVENNEEALYEGLKKIIMDSTLREEYRKLAIERKVNFEMGNRIKEIEELFDGKL